jgi:hypothetical protein
MAKDVRITPDSQMGIKGVSGAEHVHIDIETIEKIRHIAPVAAHIKEVNHIDPISVDALNVSEVKNIEPINVERFNVTDLPTVNLSVRQIPAVNMHIRQLPAVSVGTHQNFQMPSNYTVRARLFGIEFLRVHLDGQTTVVPRERYRREQGQMPNRSFPATATAGNPAIPSSCHETSATTVRALPPPRSGAGCGPGTPRRYGLGASPQVAGNPAGSEFAPGHPGSSDALSVGPPAMSFHISDAGPMGNYGGGSVSSGG